LWLCATSDDGSGKICAVTDVQIGVLGRILEGTETGRVVEVIDDGPNTGGYLIFTYADMDRSPEVFDGWVESRPDVDRYFEESGWQIDWARA
jgi:hypothetical protein